MWNDSLGFRIVKILREFAYSAHQKFVALTSMSLTAALTSIVLGSCVV